MDTSGFYRMWGKTDEDKRNKGRWHSVLCHCVDVAVVARESLKMDSRLRRMLCNALRMKEADLMEFVPFFVALHDVGKISYPFQKKVPELFEWAKGKYGEILGNDDTRHEKVTRFLMMDMARRSPEFFRSYFQFKNDDFARELAVILSVHHGHLHGSGSCYEVAQREWLSAQRELSDRLFYLFRPSGRKFLVCRPSTKTCVLLAGLLIESDWVGSVQYVKAGGSGRMPLFSTRFAKGDTGEIDIKKYAEEVGVKAKGILKTFRLHECPRPRKSKFKDLFKELFSKTGFRDSPNEMQKIVIDLVRYRSIVPTKQFFVLINHPTGQGKTEAAIYLSEAAGTGELFLLPSQATSNSMYDRRVRYINDRKGGTGESVPIELSHSMRAFSDIHSKLTLEMYKGASEDGACTTEFFGSSKKALMCLNCMATADQAAMGTLPSKHMFLRLYAMAGKTVIIDEVHSYQVYTQEFLLTLIEWLKVLGCNVIVLSATITSELKQRIVESFGGNLSDSQASTYPCVVSMQNGRVSVHEVPAKPEERREVDIEWASGIGQAIAQMAAVADQPNFTGVIFCNTVDDTQKAYDMAKVAMGLKDDEICLHAKMPVFQRQEFEKRLLSRLEPNGAKERKGRLVVVASQVAEQSLNFDCDFMVLYLCPIDIVLQRLGRLHRFNIDRPKGCEKARAVIVDTSSMEFGTSRNIYHKYVLRKTLEVLRKYKTISIPDDMQAMVDAVYPGFNPEEDTGVCSHSSFDNDSGDEELRDLNARTMRDMVNARAAVVKPMTPSEICKERDRIVSSGVDEDDLEAHVRKCLPTRKIVVLFRKDGKLYLDWNFSSEGEVDLDNLRLKSADSSNPYAATRELTSRMALNSVSVYAYQFDKCSAHAGKHTYDPWEDKPFLRDCFPEVFEEAGPSLFKNGRGMRLSKEKGLLFDT